jgi:hypothetical protein
MSMTGQQDAHSTQEGRVDRLRSYLLEVAKAGRESKLDNLYLWPRTPLEKIQERIRRRIGASDTDSHLSYSRPGIIAAALHELRTAGLIPAAFTLIDVACGDAIVIKTLKEIFPEAAIFGVDCNVDRISSHGGVRAVGVELFPGYIQDLFQMVSPEPWDVVVMLNTYRGWQSADLREHERDLPQLADAWFIQNARYLVLTLTREQISHFRVKGFQVVLLGKGEDDSLAALLTLDAPPPPWPKRRFLTNWILAKVATGFWKYRKVLSF